MNQLNHVAIIMDGNGRWAEKRSLPRTEGHKKGLKVAERIINHSISLGIKYLSLFVFSTENWKRSDKEVKTLFSLAEKYVSNFQDFCKKDIRVVVSGERSGLPGSLLNKIDDITRQTAGNSAICVNLCVNYGGQSEIVRAANSVVRSGKSITVENIRENLYNAFLPPPDLLIRTGGQKRLSNFMLYQCAYSELYFTDTLWPDFSNKEYDGIVSDFAQRIRNFGGITDA